MRLIGLAAGVLVCALALLSTADSAAQAPRSELSRSQRAALQAILTALDATPPEPAIPDEDWPLHVLRASDGSHYVAFSLHGQPGLASGRPLVFYVRLATAGASARERSAVAEWLAGQTPMPPQGQRGIAFGDMPTFGAGSVATRGPGAQSQTLQLLELQRERAREKREAEERRRRAELEGAGMGAATMARALLPFEDFDVRTLDSPAPGALPVLRRSVTAGPGEYELAVGWADPSARDIASSARVVRRRIVLPRASTTELALSTPIVADAVSLRDTPRAPSDQTAFPYSLGALDIVPARDHRLTPEERLTVVVQVINARGTPDGMPDVLVGFRVFRRDGGTEHLVGTLVPQRYNVETLPPDFDVRLRHPIFAAVGVPLRDFRRGEYRLEISAQDRVAGRGVTASVSFTITATPRTLLADAPPLAARFDAHSIAGALRQLLAAAQPEDTVRIMNGAQRASEGRDREAIALWEEAAPRTDRTLLAPLLVGALLRIGDAARAAQVAREALERGGDPRPLVAQLAAAEILAGRRAEALEMLERRLAADAEDLDALWLAIHALFVGHVEGQGPGSDPSGRARLDEHLTRYIAAGGAHTDLAREWLAVLR
jgi:hypothetical protein